MQLGNFLLQTGDIQQQLGCLLVLLCRGQMQRREEEETVVSRVREVRVGAVLKQQRGRAQNPLGLLSAILLCIRGVTSC